MSTSIGSTRVAATAYGIGRLVLRFSEPLDLASATNTANYRLAKWTYPWNSSYGSKQLFSLDRPGQPGPDQTVEVTFIVPPDGAWHYDHFWS